MGVFCSLWCPRLQMEVVLDESVYIYIYIYSETCHILGM